MATAQVTLESYMEALLGYRDPKPAYAADRASLRRFLDRAFA